MQVMQKAIALGLIFLFASCATERSGHAARSASEAQAEAQLKRAENEWKAHPLRDYTFKVRYSSFILPFGCSVQTFHVSGGRSSSINPRSCGARGDKFGSIPALFRLAHDLLAEERGDANAKFDPTYAYPSRFYVGRSGIEDNFFLVEVVEFSPGLQKSEP